MRNLIYSASFQIINLKSCQINYRAPLFLKRKKLLLKQRATAGLHCNLKARQENSRAQCAQCAELSQFMVIAC